MKLTYLILISGLYSSSCNFLRSDECNKLTNKLEWVNSITESTQIELGNDGYSLVQKEPNNRRIIKYFVRNIDEPTKQEREWCKSRLESLTKIIN